MKYVYFTNNILKLWRYFWPFLYFYLYSVFCFILIADSETDGVCSSRLMVAAMCQIRRLSGSFKCFHFLPLFFSPSCYCGRSCVSYPSSWSVFSLCSLCFSVFLNLSKLPICQVSSCHHCTELCVCFKLLIKVLKEFFTLCKYNLILCDSFNLSYKKMHCFCAAVDKNTYCTVC